MATMGHAYSTIMAGSTIIPTETKNIAPNKSLTGATSFSILSASTVSAKIEPMMKAPKAGEKPTFAASTTIPKHIAKETISNVSLPIHLRERFRKIGIRYIPTTNQRIRKNTNLPIL